MALGGSCLPFGFSVCGVRCGGLGSPLSGMVLGGSCFPLGFSVCGVRSCGCGGLGSPLSGMVLGGSCWLVGFCICGLRSCGDLGWSFSTEMGSRRGLEGGASVFDNLPDSLPTIGDLNRSTLADLASVARLSLALSKALPSDSRR